MRTVLGRKVGSARLLAKRVGILLDHACRAVASESTLVEDARSGRDGESASNRQEGEPRAHGGRRRVGRVKERKRRGEGEQPDRRGRADPAKKKVRGSRTSGLSSGVPTADATARPDRAPELSLQKVIDTRGPSDRSACSDESSRRTIPGRQEQSSGAEFRERCGRYRSGRLYRSQTLQ